jgi:hypothetical protein
MRPTCAPLPVRLAVLGACLVSALVLNDCDDATLGSSPPGGASGQAGGGHGGASMVVTDAASDGRVIEPDGGPANDGMIGSGGVAGAMGSAGTNGAGASDGTDGSAD